MEEIEKEEGLIPLISSDDQPKEESKLDITLLNDSFIDRNINIGDQEVQIKSVEDLICGVSNTEESSILGKSKSKVIHKQTELSQDCFIGPETAPSELLSDIIKVDMDEVLTSRLNVRKSCFKVQTVDKIMSWQKREITEPLLMMSDNLKPIPVQTFRNILSYMSDRKSSKKSISHARKILKITIKEEQIIKDEVFLQVFKQIRNNPRYDSLIKGWKLLAILSSVYSPSQEIYYLILNHLFFEVQNNNDQNIVNHANYIFVRMLRTKDAQRVYVPCTQELEYIEYLKSIPLPLYFFNGSQMNVKVESYTTIKQLKEEMMKNLEFNQSKALYYAIYEICSKQSGTEERFIEDSEKICDVIAVWKSDKNKAIRKKENIDFKLYLKLLIYYPYEADDYDTISVLYYQTSYDVISGKFKLTKEELLVLAALKVLNEFGSDMEDAYNGVQKHIENYIPEFGISLLSKDQWIQNILQIYQSISYYSKQEAKVCYIKQIENNILFKTNQFDAVFNHEKSGSNDDNITKNCIIGIKPECIVITDDKRKYIVSYPYEIIANWGISKDQFIFNISQEEGLIKKVCFSTHQTKIIHNLLTIYCNLLIGKTLKDLIAILETDDSKLKKMEHSRARGSSRYRKMQASGNAVRNDDPNVISTAKESEAVNDGDDEEEEIADDKIIVNV